MSQRAKLDTDHDLKYMELISQENYVHHVTKLDITLCPVCKKPDSIAEGDISTLDGAIALDFECRACGFEWLEVYQLTGYDYTRYVTS